MIANYPLLGNYNNGCAAVQSTALVSVCDDEEPLWLQSVCKPGSRLQRRSREGRVGVASVLHHSVQWRGQRCTSATELQWNEIVPLWSPMFKHCSGALLQGRKARRSWLPVYNLRACAVASRDSVSDQRWNLIRVLRFAQNVGVSERSLSRDSFSWSVFLTPLSTSLPIHSQSAGETFGVNTGLKGTTAAGVRMEGAILFHFESSGFPSRTMKTSKILEAREAASLCLKAAKGEWMKKRVPTVNTLK